MILGILALAGCASHEGAVNMPEAMRKDMNADVERGMEMISKQPAPTGQE